MPVSSTTERLLIGVYGADPLVHTRWIADAFRPQRRLRKALLQIADDGARLVNREIAMPQDRHAIEGMERKMGRPTHLGFEIVERVGHVLVREDEPHDVHERAARKSVYDHSRHAALLG